jgi:hypothetical protein
LQRLDFTVNWSAVKEIATLSAPKAAPETPSRGLSPEEKRQLVQRVIGSQAFSRTPAMRAFLRYITENEILGRTEKLKEQTIGVEVLGRPADYNPTDDNIVRVRAHELRGRLEKYFDSEGANEPFIITVPRGAYVPEFIPRKAAPAKAAQLPGSSPEAPGTPSSPPAPPANAPPAARSGSRSPWRLAAAAAAIAAALGAAAGAHFAGRNRSPGRNRIPVAVGDFWGQFFPRPGADLKVVYADSSFALWQRMAGKDLNLGDYLSHRYLDTANGLVEIAAQRSTSPADFNTSLRLATLAAQFSGQVTPQFARDANAQFFHQGNLVLIGSRRSNPWVEIYEPSLNFQLAQDPHSESPMFVNRSPKPHEAASYGIPALNETSAPKDGTFIEGAEDKEYTSYGVVALVKRCGDSGLTVLVEGLNLQASQAAGDMIIEPQLLDGLLRSIGHRPGTTVAPFEALFQIRSLPGGYSDSKVVAYRLRAPEACVGD